MREGALIIVDEIQKAPVLLNYVQMAIDQRKQRFVLSGSSARKLKRGGETSWEGELWTSACIH
jgi:uncharacterized protein